MSVVLLVRHGQASFGTEDYDRLSPLGEGQARQLGAALRRTTPTRLVAGSMRRQEATAKLVADSAGWTAHLSTDPDWNEFDHLRLVGPDAPTDPRAFQAALEDAMRRWSGGGQAEETFDAFTNRVSGALARLTAELGSGDTAVVVTSAGVISWLAATLLGGNIEQWIRMNRVCANAAVTKLVAGRQGLSLVSFNEHGHLDASAITYR